MLELLVLKNLHQCTSQHVKWTSGARVSDGRTDGRSDGRTVGRTVGRSVGRSDSRMDGLTVLFA